MTNLEKMKIELRDQNGTIFNDTELESFLIDNSLNKNDEYVLENKPKLMLSVRDALRSLLRDWNAAQTKISGDMQESYSKGGIVSEIEKIERTYLNDLIIGAMEYEDWTCRF